MNDQADLIFVGGRVHTVNPPTTSCRRWPWGGRVLAAGVDAEIRALAGSRARVVVLLGRSLLPGFVDGHCHLTGLGMAAASIDCKAPGMQSIAALQAAVRQRAASQPPGTWIRGRGYDQSRLKEKRHPNRLDWDAVAPDHPVIFTRTCGHISSVNGRALAAARIDDATADPAGGRYDRDGGRNLGVAYETALTPLQVAAMPSTEEFRDALLRADAAYIEAGGTSVHDAGGLVGVRTGPGAGRRRPPAPADLRLRDGEQSPASAHGVAGHRRPHRSRQRAAPARRVQGDDRRFLQRADRRHARALHLRLPRLRHPLLVAGRSRRSHRPRPPAGIPVHGARGGRPGDRADAERDGPCAARSPARATSPHRARGICPPDLQTRVREQRILPIMQPAFFWEFGDGYIANYGQARVDTMFPARRRWPPACRWWARPTRRSRTTRPCSASSRR
jgi:hypothetical protein